MACRLFNRSAVIRFFLLFLFLVPAGHPSPAFSDTAEAWYETGFERVLEGKTRQAESAFLRALELKPGWAEAHHQLGVLYFQSQRGPAAIFHLRQAEQAYKGRNDPQARRNLPVVRRNLEKAYRRFGLKPEDFDVAEFEPAPAAEAWSPRGAGFLLGRGGFLLAPLHTVREARKIRVRFAGGTPARRNGSGPSSSTTWPFCGSCRRRPKAPREPSCPGLPCCAREKRFMPGLQPMGPAILPEF